MATTALVIPFKRPAFPAREPDYSHLARYAYRAAQADHKAQRDTDIEELRDALRCALDDGAARRALGTLADLKRRVEELERKLSA